MTLILSTRGSQKTFQDSSTLTTQGDIDLLGEVVGGGNYEQLIGHCETMQLFGQPINVVTLPTLIHLKRSAGRPKDLIAVAELEVLQQERTPKP
jgi:hypothetical protein